MPTVNEVRYPTGRNHSMAAYFDLIDKWLSRWPFTPESRVRIPLRPSAHGETKGTVRRQYGQALLCRNYAGIVLSANMSAFQAEEDGAAPSIRSMGN